MDQQVTEGGGRPPPQDDHDGIEYRLARPSDEDAIAALHAESWGRAFRGLLPDSYLDGEAVVERAEVWRQRFADPTRAGRTVTIVADQDGDVVAFIYSVLDDDPVWGTLLDNLHVRHDLQGRGVARRLIGDTGEALRERGRRRAHLFVLQANRRAIRLYEGLGGRIVERGAWDSPAGVTVPSYRVAWRDLAVSVAASSGG